MDEVAHPIEHPALFGPHECAGIARHLISQCSAVQPAIERRHATGKGRKVVIPVTDLAIEARREVRDHVGITDPTADDHQIDVALRRSRALRRRSVDEGGIDARRNYKAVRGTTSTVTWDKTRKCAKRSR